MNAKRPFAKRKGAAGPSPGPLMSFRFNKRDEEVEEVSCEKNESFADPIDPLICSKILPPENYEADTSDRIHEEDKIKGKEYAPSKVERSNAELLDIQKNEFKHVSSNDEQPDKNELSVKDSLKNYHSKSSHRACSLDSESSSVEVESWAFLKDLKGKIAKNIEECINKDVGKGHFSEVEIVEGSKIAKAANDSTYEPDQLKLGLSSTGSDAAMDDDHISPSIEATENLDEKSGSWLDNNYSNSEIEIVKSERHETPVSIAKSQFGLPMKKKKVDPKPDFNMKLSALMASRSFSSEDDQSEKNELKPGNLSEKPSSVITGDKPADEVISPVLKTSTKSKKSECSQIFLQMHNFCLFVKTLWSKNIAFALFAYSILPIPSAIRWFLTGAILSALFMYWMMKPAAKKEPFKMPDYTKLPPLTIPALDITCETIYKGWMNELPFEYNPDTYHVNYTHSVYIRLDGSSLRVSYPKTNIPKRAMYNEPRHELASLYPRHHDITGASIELLPKGLPKKRLWSKKYPICLKFTDQRQSLPFSSGEVSTPDQRSSRVQASKESSPSKKFEPKLNEHGEIVLYLFARTDREKDDWYRRFLKASRIKMLKSHSPLSSPNIASLENSLSENKRAVSVDLGALQTSASLTNMYSFDEQEIDDEAFAEIKFDKQLKFDYYMTQLLSNTSSDISSDKRKSHGKERSEILDAKTSAQVSQDLLWLNALIGRLFFDFLIEEVWADVVAERIQKKLSKIKLPNFMEELRITDMNLGSALPKIHRTSNPVVDQRGLWLDIDISYNGCFQMTLETKLNLLRLQKSDYPFSTYCTEKELEDLPVRHHVYDSEEEDSAESSSDDDVPMPEINASASIEESSTSASSSGSSTGKKLIRLVDKIAQSSYFQSAAKNKYFQRAMVEVSNTPLVLTVEVCWLTGTLALNIPPMPTDRLWYGFRKNPELCIQARPKLGCRAVTVSHITDWIEKKLVLEFQKVLVMPNMDDLVIPIMHSDVGMSQT